MKKTLKWHRKINNLSQQQLSNISGISIRTIQRIEKNLSSGSPFILKSLCKALKIDILNLDIEPQNEEEVSENEPIQAKNTELKRVNLINLSALSVILFPLLNLIIPIILFLKFKKQEINKAEGLKILSFQILWTFSTLFLMFLIPAMLTPFFAVLSSGRFPLFVLVYFLCVAVNVYFIIHTAIQLNKSQQILHFVPNIL